MNVLVAWLSSRRFLKSSSLGLCVCQSFPFLLAPCCWSLYFSSKRFVLLSATQMVLPRVPVRIWYLDMEFCLSLHRLPTAFSPTARLFSQASPLQVRTAEWTRTSLNQTNCFIWSTHMINTIFLWLCHKRITDISNLSISKELSNFSSLHYKTHIKTPSEPCSSLWANPLNFKFESSMRNWGFCAVS